MPSKKPTIADLDSKLDAALTEFKAMSHQVNVLWTWKEQEDAYKAALKRIKDEEREAAQDSATKEWVKVAKTVGTILAIVSAILYAWAQSRGIH